MLPRLPRSPLLKRTGGPGRDPDIEEVEEAMEVTGETDERKDTGETKESEIAIKVDPGKPEPGRLPTLLEAAEVEYGENGIQETEVVDEDEGVITIDLKGGSRDEEEEEITIDLKRGRDERDEEEE